MSLEITWLGHGTFQFRLPSGQVVLMDPWTDGNPSYPAGYQIPHVDVMCITHGHFDHIHDAVPLAQRFSPQVVGIYETCVWLESKGVKNTRPMNKGGSQEIGELTITMTHAVHSCGILDEGRIIYGGEAAGYVLRFGGRSVYFAGDTNVFSDMQLIQQLYKPELAFLPIGDLFTMSPAEAALACKLLGAKKVIPMHFGTFPPLTGRPGQLSSLVSGVAEVWELKPGEPVNWQLLPGNLAQDA
jgi:L-ascorbate metabolism protein UlaG (beta-lactamase superfamily)